MSSSSARLTQIADALGVPVAALLEPETLEGDLGDARELMRLWLLIRSADDRRTVLEGIRKVVAAQPEV